MADMYGFSSQTLTPATADKCTVNFGGRQAGAVQVNFAYNQTINKRRSMGNAGCIVWASQPGGQITISKMVVEGLVKGGPGFSACTPVNASFSLSGCSGGGSVQATGCVVSQYTVTAETDGMTVMENIVIDCVSMS